MNLILCSGCLSHCLNSVHIFDMKAVGPVLLGLSPLFSLFLSDAAGCQWAFGNQL